ncbi:hypothetical protein [Haloarchaeobius sp. HME9146]|uniref:hypothetical protein n=1 Tax=Haloarchaeobius sp. HME9146 TaxID=2978732 RepID=UPI0021C06904|nr:hypothetical protein [Haloarchaeobius sp. HME9146]MCT9095281.1 hypothetical protein [Haloarchaeobius sp. HME9146]
MGNEQQYATNELDALTDALSSQATDEMRVTSPGTLTTDITDRTGRNLGKLRLMDSGEVLIDPATEGTLQAIAAALSSNATDSLLVDSNAALDVSAAQVDVDLAAQTLGSIDVDLAAQTLAEVAVDLSAQTGGPLDVSAAEIDVDLNSQTGGPLDVSAAEVDVDLASQTSGPIDVSGATVETAETALPGLLHGQDSTSAADTPVALNGGTSAAVPAGATLRVKALSGNGGSVFVGGAGVTTGDGYELASGESTTLGVDDVSTVYIVDGTGGLGVSWVVEQ